MALKHIVSKLRCLWEGHDPIPVTFYSAAYGQRVSCVICKHCLKVL